MPRLLRLAPLIGLVSVVALGLVLQLLLQWDVLSVYVIPLPSDVLASLWRVTVEEDIPSRFLLTVGETLAAGLMILLVGVPAGLLLYRSTRMRVAFEPWVAALAAAPLVLAYPLFLVLFGRSALTIIVIGFASGLAR